MNYISTRNNIEPVSAAQAIARGMVPDGGLFVPAEIPVLSAEEIASMAGKSYQELAQWILGKYLTDYTAEDIAELSIPFTFFAFIILIVWITTWISYRKQRDRYHIIEKAIDNGQAIPEGLFDEPKKAQKRWTNTLRQAIIFIAIGIGLAIFGYTIGENVITAIAVIPGIIGAGYLLIAFIERHEERKEDAKEHNEDSTALAASQNTETEA